ncbi:MAG TPA: hypothetical protein VHM29_01465, partial [Acidimicrobiia bacterium]|nr:hypothetical protein [Acidimicrobiia bacterium]
MNELLERADPASAAEIDKAGLRSRVDEMIGLTAGLVRRPVRRRRPLVAALASAGAVIAVGAIVLALRPQPGRDVL